MNPQKPHTRFILFLALYLALGNGTAHAQYAQCSLSAYISATGLNCSQGQLTANSTQTLSNIIWQKDGATVSTATVAGPVITTVAGGNGAGTAASQLQYPEGIFVDANGNVYVTDDLNSRVQKWAPGATSGITVAGGNGQGSAANQLMFPSAILVDGSGTMYISDFSNARVQKWTAGATSGITVAGGNLGGPGANQLDGPKGLALDAAGNLYIADMGNARIQEWAPGATSGITVAGGNGAGPAANQFEKPFDVKLDKAGNLYIADWINGRVQKWAPGATSGVTIAGGKGSLDGPDQLVEPTALFIDANDNVYIADGGNNRVQEWTPGAIDGITVAGDNAAGNAMNQFYQPAGVFLDAFGNIYVSDQNNHRVQKWSPAPPIDNSYTATAPGTYTATLTDVNGCTMTTNPIVIDGLSQVSIASTTGNCGGATLTASTTDLSSIVWYNGTAPQKTANAPGVPTGSGITVAGGNGYGDADNQMEAPGSIQVDANGDIFVSDADRIQEWKPGATAGITVAGGNGPGVTDNQLNAAAGFRLDAAGNIYVADFGNSRVEKWAPGATTGVRVAGGSYGGGPQDLNRPSDLFLGTNGNIYISDLGNNRVQEWAPGATSGITVAGGNGPGPAANQLNAPEGIWVDAAGDVYVSDWGNNRIQKWAPGASSGVTVAGGNGQGDAANQLYQPGGIFFDGSGNLYIADGGNNRVEKYPPGATSGITVAGGNGSGSAADQLYFPSDLFVDANGNLYVADAGNSRIQEWTQNTPIDAQYAPAAPGVYTATITTRSGCTYTTNALTILPSVTPAVSIAASATSVCAGTPVKFTATPANGGTAPVYQWTVNGLAGGANSLLFSSSSLPDGASVSCSMTSNATCPSTPTVTATPITLNVNPYPVIAPGQVFEINAGQGLTLNPVISGDPSSYSWSPATGLSDPSISDPVADPVLSTNYTLKVVSGEGCADSAAITVKVNRPLRIPGAFTPNGDGKNDIFYILGGPAGSLVKDFSVFGRWGEIVFKVENVPPGDPASGWNGYFNGNPMPAGAYVYMALMRFSDGTQQLYRGTVMLIR